MEKRRAGGGLTRSEEIKVISRARSESVLATRIPLGAAAWLKSNSIFRGGLTGVARSLRAT